MRRIVIVLTGFAVVWFAGGRLSGQQQSTSLAVNASVSKNCTITTAPVNFGAYDPVTANATAPLDGVGTITVTCTKGAGVTLALNPGSNATGSQRRMSQGTNYLLYELYTDASHSTVWGDIGNNPMTIPPAPNRNPRPFTVYGRVAQAQDATVGAYADTVVATVVF